MLSNTCHQYTLDNCYYMSIIRSVLGDISPQDLGITSVHEHLLLDVSCYLEALMPAHLTASQIKLMNSPVKIDILGDLMFDPMMNKANLLLEDLKLAIKELSAFKAMGGDSIVDTTPPGAGRDIKKLRVISEATKINIIASTGWYAYPSHTPIVEKSSKTELADIMVKELTEGADNTDIKTGIIKCAIGGLTGNPESPIESRVMHPDEEKVLRAAALAQKITGSCITVHPCVSKKDGHKYLDILLEEEADISHFYLGHMDITYPDIDLKYLTSLLDRDISISLDCFGWEYYSGTFYKGSYIPDKERINAVVALCEQGYEKQIMLAQDVATKNRLVKYGGYGYGHLLKNIIPRIKNNGVSNKQIEQMLKLNPKNLLPIKK